MEKIEKVDFDLAQEIVEQYIEKNSKKEHRFSVMSFEMEALEKSWSAVEERYFEILSMVTQKPIFAEKFSCFFTTGFVCPYNEKENWFMVSMWHSIPFSVTTICHELMHLQFLNYYKNYLKEQGCTNEQIEDLKEAMTFLLNEKDFDDIILSQDVGYPEHVELRAKLKNIWSKNQNFQNLLDEGILLVK